MVVHKPAGHSKCSSLEDVLPRSSMFYHGAEFVGVVLLCITSSQTKARAKRATGGLGGWPPRKKAMSGNRTKFRGERRKLNLLLIARFASSIGNYLGIASLGRLRCLLPCEGRQVLDAN